MIDEPLEPHLALYLRTNTRIRDAATREHYWRSLRQFGEQLGHQPRTGDLTDEQLAAFMLSTLEAGLSPATANQRAKQLRAFWNWCAKKRVVELFPTFRDLDEPEPMPEAWDEIELHQLFTGCAKQTGWIGPHLASTWWLSIHWWWLSTAERTEATMRCERSMIRLDKQTAKLPPHIRKGGRKGAVYHLPDRLCEILEQMFRVPSPTGLVWDTHWRQWQTLFTRYRRLVTSSGLIYVRGKTTPQKMRNTAYTMMEICGDNPLDLSCHSDPKVLEFYRDKEMLLAHKRHSWPPKGLNPEQRPKTWRNGWGLLGAG